MRIAYRNSCEGEKKQKGRALNLKHALVAFHIKVPYALKRHAGACLQVFLFSLEENNFLTL